MSYAIEIKSGEWYGVKLPEGVRVFDCRRPVGEEYQRSPWDTPILGTEAAAFDLGLRPERFTRYDTTMLSCSTYTDSRKCSEAELTRQVTGMVNEYHSFVAAYEKAALNPAKPGEGGGIAYKPVALVLNNFGWTVVGDERMRIVEAFSR